MDRAMGVESDGTAAVFIKLRCPTCTKTQRAKAEESDPQGTAILEVACPDCIGPGDRTTAQYYDAEGRWFDGERFRHVDGKSEP